MHFHNSSIARPARILLSLWLLSGPCLALLGNAASDIWLSVTAAGFLAYSASLSDWSWSRALWFRLALLFWVWLLFVSLLSENPLNSLEQSATWIRFPVFVSAFSLLLAQTQGQNMIGKYWLAMLLGVLVMMSALGLEKIEHPEAERLFGTWKQSTKAGWYLLGFGLPVVYHALGKGMKKMQAMQWAVPLAALVLFFIVLTGEVYTSLAFLLGLIMFMFFGLFEKRSRLKGILAALAVLCMISALLLFSDPVLAERFYWSLTTRLPWMPSSDYYDSWMIGIETALRNPLIGIGPRNFETYCHLVEATALYTNGGCQGHPHQLYIQVAAESGFVGLAVFSAMVVSIVHQIWRQKPVEALPVDILSGICLLLVVFWPLSTYSEAFGQHKNFFTWFSVAWALHLARSSGYRNEAPDASSQG